MNATSTGSEPPLSFSYPLYSSDVFDGLPERVISALPGITRTEKYGSGDSIFEIGEVPSNIVKVESGKALLSYKPRGRKTVRTRTLEPDELWCLTEILADAPMEVALRSTGPTVVRLISATEFIRLIRKENSLCFRLLKILSSRYQAKWARIKARINGKNSV